jgi:hypothetical protein
MELVNINSFRCTKFDLSTEILVTSQFDINNPCSYCNNLKREGVSSERGVAFFYREFGRWEFPFVAEASCQNFSLIYTSGSKTISKKELEIAHQFYKNFDRINRLGHKYDVHWAAFDPREVSRFQETKLEAGRIYYPHGVSAVDFYKDLTKFRSDIFELRTELKQEMSKFSKKFGIVDRNVCRWVEDTQKALNTCLRQIEELEEKPPENIFATISKWGFDNIGGNLAYDVVKMTFAIIRKAVLGF